MTDFHEGMRTLAAVIAITICVLMAGTWMKTTHLNLDKQEMRR